PGWAWTEAGLRAGGAVRAGSGVTPATALGRKLSRLTSLGPSPAPSPPSPPPAPVESDVGLGEPRATPHGALHVTERLYAGEHRHGTVAVSSALEAVPAHVAALALDARMGAVDLRGALL